jgi:hypothetical protein
MEVVVLSITNANQEHNSMNNSCPLISNQPFLTLYKGKTYVLQKGSSRSIELGIFRGVLWA